VGVIINVAVDRAADGRALEQSVADREPAERAGELDPQTRELDAGRWAAGLLRSGSDPLERRLSAHDEVPDVENAFLRRQIGALRIERYPHLAAGDFLIDIGEAEESTRVVAFDENELAAVAPGSAQVAEERRTAPELALQSKAHDHAATPGYAQIESAQGFVVEAEHGADLDVEIDVLVWFLLAAGGASQRRLDEAAPVESIAAQRDPQRTVASALRFERSLIPVGERKGGGICGDDFTGGVGLGRAFDPSAGPFPHPGL